MGLAICKRLVEHHGGTITAESDGADRGATFTVVLPLPAIRERAAGAKPTAHSEASEMSRQDFDLTGLTILLVEDETETRNAVTALLHKAAQGPVGNVKQRSNSGVSAVASRPAGERYWHARRGWL